ncbi:hypothetical protein EGW08_020715 [Elysia chlorotica]|uniref:Uncharacterized protein n=1 Tax=Elysia chlorotica TaxID=188477 RepID=A0A3S0Z841_ELYCH|nr:hypothetical protein EGW08_020715 [Elysia chlorotica]
MDIKGAAYQGRQASGVDPPAGAAHREVSAANNSGDDGKFDLRQFVNSTSRWPLQADVQTPAPRYGVGGAASGGDGGGGGGGDATLFPDMLLPPREREPLELCDLPGQLARCVWSGRIFGAAVAAFQAFLLWLRWLALGRHAPRRGRALGVAAASRRREERLLALAGPAPPRPAPLLQLPRGQVQGPLPRRLRADGRLGRRL